MRQSQRTELYEEALARAARRGLIYECWCTRARDPRGGVGAARRRCPRAPTRARAAQLTAAQRAEREAAGRPPALRVRADAARRRLRGPPAGRVEGVVDDFVVRRNDGAFAYNLAVVVDDADQGIGEVVRGADLLDSTPRQLWLGARLGLAGARATPTCRSCSAPTARGWPSATAR